MIVNRKACDSRQNTSLFLSFYFVKQTKNAIHRLKMLLVGFVFFCSYNKIIPLIFASV